MGIGVTSCDLPQAVFVLEVSWPAPAGVVNFQLESLLTRVYLFSVFNSVSSYLLTAGEREVVLRAGN